MKRYIVILENENEFDLMLNQTNDPNVILKAVISKYGTITEEDKDCILDEAYQVCKPI